MEILLKIGSRGKMWIGYNYITFSIILYIFPVSAFSVFSQNPIAVSQEPTYEELNWLRNQVYPVKTFDPTNEDYSDLDILGKIVGDSKVVALGENTHDSKQIFNLKHRIIKYLVTNNNFDVFALEANMPESNNFNFFLNKCQDSPLDLIKGLHYKWIWRNQEFIELIEWMRTSNLENSQITFTGVDMQFYQGPIIELEKLYNENNDVLDQIKELEDLLFEINKKAESSNPTIPHRNIRKSNKILSALKKSAINLPHKNKEWVFQNVRLLEQFILDKNSPKLSSLRDSYMAENLLWTMMQNPESKIIVWAHNEHVKKTNRAMGEFLSKSLEDDYVNIGFTFGRGNYNAINPVNMEVSVYEADKSPKGSYEYYFDQLGADSFILDLRTIKKENSKMAEWLLKSHLFRRIGSLKPKNEFAETNLTEDYDIIIYIKESSATKILN